MNSGLGGLPSHFGKPHNHIAPILVIGAGGTPSGPVNVNGYTALPPQILSLPSLIGTQQYGPLHFQVYNSNINAAPTFMSTALELDPIISGTTTGLWCLGNSTYLPFVKATTDNTISIRFKAYSFLFDAVNIANAIWQIMPSTDTYPGSWKSGTTAACLILSDTILSRAAAATFQLGAANAASPVNQTLQAQGSIAGTSSNVGGASITVQPGTGTGTGTAASIILKAPVLAASGTGAQTQTTALTVIGSANGQLPSVVVGSAALATNATDGFIYIPAGAGAPSGTPTAFTGRVPFYYDSTNDQLYVYNGAWKQPKTPAGAALVNWQ